MLAKPSEVPYLKTLVTLGGPVFKAGLVLILVPNLRDLGPITPQLACPVLTRQQGGSPSHGNASALSKECCAALLNRYHWIQILSFPCNAQI